MGSALREKLKMFGVTDLSNKVISAALVDEERIQTILQEVKDLNIKLYTACRDMDGAKLPGGASWVSDATSKEILGGLQAAPLALSQTAKLTPLDIWQIEPKTPKDEPQTRSPEAEADGILPVDELRELFNLPDEDRGALPVEPGRTLAKVLPPDPLLWARMVMQQRKEAGAGSPAYTLKKRGAGAGL